MGATENLYMPFLMQLGYTLVTSVEKNFLYISALQTKLGCDASVLFSWEHGIGKLGQTFRQTQDLRTELLWNRDYANRTQIAKHRIRN